jgi:hypothetical protein
MSRETAQPAGVCCRSAPEGSLVIPRTATIGALQPMGDGTTKVL